jgi:predicted ATP-dependent Lon-type protease
MDVARSYNDSHTCISRSTKEEAGAKEMSSSVLQDNRLGAGTVKKLQAMGLKPTRMFALEIGEYADMYIAQDHEEFIAKATQQYQFLVKHDYSRGEEAKETSITIEEEQRWTS